jgi:hypothetical protein
MDLTTQIEAWIAAQKKIEQQGEFDALNFTNVDLELLINYSAEDLTYAIKAAINENRFNAAESLVNAGLTMYPDNIELSNQAFRTATLLGNDLLLIKRYEGIIGFDHRCLTFSGYEGFFETLIRNKKFKRAQSILDMTIALYGQHPEFNKGYWERRLSRSLSKSQTDISKSD